VEAVFRIGFDQASQHGNDTQQTVLAGQNLILSRIGASSVMAITITITIMKCQNEKAAMRSLSLLSS